MVHLKVSFSRDGVSAAKPNNQKPHQHSINRKRKRPKEKKRMKMLQKKTP
jgi:hypothetical protein